MQSPVMLTAFVALMLAIVLCVVLIPLAMVMDDPPSGLGRMIGTSLLFALCAGLWMASAAVGTKRRSFQLPMVAAASGVAIGLMFIVAVIWRQRSMGRPDAELYTQIGTTLLLLSGAVIHAGVFSILPGRGTPLTILKVVTSGAVAALALLICMMMWFEDLIEEIAGNANIGFWTLLGLLFTSGFLSIAGTVVVPIASLASARKQYRSEWLRRDVMLTLACPKCGQQQVQPQGRSRCENCRATIIVELEEPRCECGYLLFELHGDTCPECGRRVDAAAANPQPAAP